jgi:hypothetical protein
MAAFPGGMGEGGVAVRGVGGGLAGRIRPPPGRLVQRVPSWHTRKRPRKAAAMSSQSVSRRGGMMEYKLRRKHQLHPAAPRAASLWRVITLPVGTRHQFQRKSPSERTARIFQHHASLNAPWQEGSIEYVPYTNRSGQDPTFGQKFTKREQSIQETKNLGAYTSRPAEASTIECSANAPRKM